MSDRGKILIIRGGAIGDMILTVPAITALRRHFADARIELLGYPHIAAIIHAAGLVDGVRPIEARPLAGFFAAGGMLSEDLRQYFAGFDLIVSYLYDPDRIFRENVGRCSTAQFIQCPHRANEADGIHACEVYLKPLEELAIFEADPVPRLRVPTVSLTGLIAEGAITGAASANWTRIVALHPGSGSERKNWPEYKWRELISILLDRTTWQLLIVGGEAELDRIDRLTRDLPTDRVACARSLPLVRLAGLLQNARAFVGHDSGITHLASALGLNCVAIWAHTDPAVWRPLAPNTAIIRSRHGINAITVEEVWTTLVGMLD